MLRTIFCLIASLGILLSHASVAAPSPQLQSKAWVLFDRLTNTTLTSKNADEKLNPGNTTALMVLYTVEQAIHNKEIQRDTKITVSNLALSLPALNAARFYVEPNKQMTVFELQQAVAVMAANDAAIALAEFVGKSVDGFVEKMNQHAKQLGMNNTHYVSPIGTHDPQQYTTANDILILADALLNDCPALNSVWTTKMLTNGVLRHKNSNALLWRTDSIKGLHSSEHQLKSWDSVAYYSRDFIESQTRFSRELIGVSLGAKSAALNADDTMRLISWGSDNYKTLLLYSAGEAVDRIPVALTNNAKVRVGVKENIYATLARDAILQEGVNGFSAKIKRMDPLVAPILEGDIIGTLTVTFNGKEVAQTDLIAQHDVQRSSFWRRTLQRIKAIFGME
ncbi:MAG: D-alanyl-D-alanine carboxypeptidase [Burkholderiaceae bacterium]|nr:D-alanyl-D-alanine carboxypeptidase [Burkholderiaceae bacterium]